MTIVYSSDDPFDYDDDDLDDEYEDWYGWYWNERDDYAEED